MELEHTFTVPVGIEQAFGVLLDLERIAPCMPGATLESVEGEEFHGKVKVKVGPMQVTYRGIARFIEVDKANHRAVIEANGKEARGSGTAKGTFVATFVDKGEETDVKVVSSLAITGRPAQFGRGVMADVGDKLLGQFADCLASELGRTEESAEPAEQPAAAAAGGPPAAERAEQPTTGPGAAGGTSAGAPAQPSIVRERPTSDTVDLLDVAGAPVLRRVAPVVAVAAVIALIVWLVRRAR